MAANLKHKKRRLIRLDQVKYTPTCALRRIPNSVLRRILFLVEDASTAACLPLVCSAFAAAWDLPGWLVETGRDDLMVTAADEGRTADLIALLEAGADLEAHGWDALSCAAEEGHAAAVEVLLSAGVCNQSADDDVLELADQAAANGHHSIAAALGAACSNRLSGAQYRRWQDEALVRAAGDGDVMALGMLLEQGLSSFSVRGCDMALREAAAHGEADAVAALLAAGVRMTDGPDGALSRAVADGHTNIVQLLLAGAGMEVGSMEAEDALAFAAAEGHLDIVELLIAAGVDVGAWGDQALQAAAGNGHWDVCMALMAAGADVHAGGDEALRQAAANGHAGVVEGLLQHGADAHAAEAVAGAAAEGQLHVLQLLLAYNAGWGAVTDEALRAAAAGGHLACCLALVDAGVTICNSSAQCWRVLLMQAAARGDADMVAALLAAGMHGQGTRSKAMAVAAARGHFGVMAAVLAAAAGVAAVDATSARHKHVVELLVVAAAEW